MRVTLILTGALGMVPKGLEKKWKNQENQEHPDHDIVKISY